MLKGFRDVVLRRVQPISVHGQISWDLHFTDVDDADGPATVARVGPEAVTGQLNPGDRLRLEYVIGQVVAVRKIDE